MLVDMSHGFAIKLLSSLVFCCRAMSLSNLARHGMFSQSLLPTIGLHPSFLCIYSQYRPLRLTPRWATSYSVS